MDISPCPLLTCRQGWGLQDGEAMKGNREQMVQPVTPWELEPTSSC